MTGGDGMGTGIKFPVGGGRRSSGISTMAGHGYRFNRHSVRAEVSTQACGQETVISFNNFDNSSLEIFSFFTGGKMPADHYPAGRTAARGKG